MLQDELAKSFYRLVTEHLKYFKEYQRAGDCFNLTYPCIKYGNWWLGMGLLCACGRLRCLIPSALVFKDVDEAS